MNCLPVVLALLVASNASAAPPKLAELFPAGGQRAQTIAVQAAGEFETWPVDFWCDRPGVHVTADQEKGKLSITIGEDVTPGVSWIRAVGPDGASSPRPFLIDQLPELEELETNDLPAQAQAVALPSIVNGRLGKSGDVDGFFVQLQAGETLAARLTANWLLGSPMDAVLQICERVERTPSAQVDKEPQVEAFIVAQNHDTRGLDPEIVYTAPRAGAYIVRAFAFPSDPNGNVSFAGGANYIYRLTLTKSGLVDHALPLAWPSDAIGEVRLSGANVTNALVALAPQSSAAERWSTVFLPNVAGATDVARVSHPCTLATEAANSERGQEVAIPQVISGRLASEQATQRFRFHANKGKKLDLSLTSRSLGFALDGVLTVHDAAGTMLQEVDDVQKEADAALTFTPPADGEYVVAVRDLYGRSGASFVYRLDILPQQPGFALTLTGDAFALTPGKTVEIPIAVERLNGFNQAIEISASDLPAGVMAETVTSEPTGDSAKGVKLVLRAADDAAPSQGVVRVSGKSAGDQHFAAYTLNFPGVPPRTDLFLVVAKP